MDPSSIPDARSMYERALAQISELVDAAKPEQLDGPTPCTEWAVRDLLEHLLTVADRIVAVAEDPEQSGRENVQAPGDDWSAVFPAAAERFRAAWAGDAALDRPAQMPFGEVPGRMAVALVASDAIVHAWDLARALDLPTDGLDAELAGPAREITGLVAPPDKREGPVPFEPVREAPADADTYTALAAWMGRDPEWAAA